MRNLPPTGSPLLPTGSTFWKHEFAAPVTIRSQRKNKAAGISSGVCWNDHPGGEVHCDSLKKQMKLSAKCLAAASLLLAAASTASAQTYWIYYGYGP